MPPKTRRQTKKDISADTMDLIENMDPLDMTDAGDIDEDIERLEKEQIYLEKLGKLEQLRRAVDRLKTKPVSTRDQDSTAPSTSESESGTHNLRKLTSRKGAIQNGGTCLGHIIRRSRAKQYGRLVFRRRHIIGSINTSQKQTSKTTN